MLQDQKTKTQFLHRPKTHPKIETQQRNLNSFVEEIARGIKWLHTKFTNSLLKVSDAGQTQILRPKRTSQGVPM